MPSQQPIPSLLSPYLALPPPTSLTLLTSTLGASANWLVLRFALAALKKDENGKGNREGNREEEGEGETRVVLVSWLRDTTFWRDGGRRVGIPSSHPSFHIVDALTTGLGVGVGVGLGLTKTHNGDGNSAGAAAGALAFVEREILRAVRAARGGGSGDGGDGGGGGGGGKDGAGDDAGHGGVRGKEEEREKKVVLVLDGLDFLLAATGATALEMTDLVSEIRSHVHSLLLTASADLPLMQQQSQQAPSTPLEIEHSAFVTGMAHLARNVLSVRELDTGGARDVSGVLRVSRGGAWEWGFDGAEGEFEERECLFYVGGDGGVRVFERGGG